MVLSLYTEEGTRLGGARRAAPHEIGVVGEEVRTGSKQAQVIAIFVGLGVQLLVELAEDLLASAAKELECDIVGKSGKYLQDTEYPILTVRFMGLGTALRASRGLRGGLRVGGAGLVVEGVVIFIQPKYKRTVLRVRVDFDILASGRAWKI